MHYKENSVDDSGNFIYVAKKILWMIYTTLCIAKKIIWIIYTTLSCIAKKIIWIIYTTLSCIAKKILWMITNNFIYCKENYVAAWFTQLYVLQRNSVGDLHITLSIAKKIMWIIYT